MVEVSRGGNQRERQPKTSELPKTAPHPFLCFCGPPGATLRQLTTPERLGALTAPGADLMAPPWLDSPANNHGFFSPFDYPFAPVASPQSTAAPFVLAIFGGSVAHWLALIAGDQIARGLENSEALKGREVTVLNVASGGFKQPQSFLALQLLLSMGQQIDSALIVDGFNEVGLGLTNWQSGFEPVAPSVAHARKTGLDVEQYRRAESLSDSPMAAAGEVASHWHRCATLTSDVAASSQIPMLHVLQPNQYYGDRVMGNQERRIAISETTPYRLGVETGYDLLRELLPDAAGDWYSVLDATGVFDDVVDPVYADNCCHYNSTGNEILASKIIEHLVRAIEAHVDLGASAAPADRPAAAQPTLGDESSEQKKSGWWRRSSKPPDDVPDDLYPMW